MQFEVMGLHPHYVDYRTAWQHQIAVHHDVVSGARPDTTVLLEHAPVYTAGKRTEPHERPLDGTPVIDVDRGGKITWHGPGQLVGYPIVYLGNRLDVVAHVRRVEQVMIDVCAHFGIAAERIKGRSGVWLPAAGPLRPERKIGAIGIRVSQNVTMHGFALNANCDLTWGGNIVPCGITDAGITSITAETGAVVTPADIVDHVQHAIVDRLPPFARPTDASATPSLSF